MYKRFRDSAGRPLRRCPGVGVGRKPEPAGAKTGGVLADTNYYHLGQVSLSHPAIDAHTRKAAATVALSEARVRKGRYARYPNERLWGTYGLPALRRRLGAFRGGGHDSSESRMRENRTSGLTGGDGETWPRWGTGHRHRAKAAGQQPLPAPTAGRASPRLYRSRTIRSRCPRDPGKRSARPALAFVSRG